MIRFPETSGVPVWWGKALVHLSAKDPRQKKLIEQFGSKSVLRKKNTAFVALANSIVGQQISVGAADSVRKKLRKGGYLSALSFKKESRVKTLKTLCAFGVSGPKATYLINLSEWFVSKNINASWFRRHSRETIATELLRIPGIGPWTLQMFEMFYTQESNILPKADLGLQKSAIQTYGIPKEKIINFLEKQSSTVWTPYSTAAVWFLWRRLDATDIHY